MRGEQGLVRLGECVGKVIWGSVLLKAYVAMASTWSSSALSDFRLIDTSCNILERCSLVRAGTAEDDMESQVRDGGLALPSEVGAGGTTQAEQPPMKDTAARSIGTTAFMVAACGDDAIHSVCVPAAAGKGAAPPAVIFGRRGQ